MAEYSNKPLVAIVGPTASGKTALSVELARAFGGEIVSADSMQIYRGMDIGTAKPTAAEMRGVPHHLMGILDIGESFNVADYARLAKAKIDEIHARGRLPFLVGGTGLYINAVVDNVDFGEMQLDAALRAELERRADTEGTEVLLRELAEFDKPLADSLHKGDRGRIIRGIEVYRTTGKTLTYYKQQSMLTPSPYDICMLGITCRDRALLYDRINTRVDNMLKTGLYEEAKTLFAGELSGTAGQAIGYKELFGCLRGEISYEQAVEELKKSTRHYAKRQLTWFNRDKRIEWLYVEDGDAEQKAKIIMEEHGIV